MDEALYLALNDDVARAIDAGVVRDAASHRRDAGAAEERAGVRPSVAETVVAPPPATYPPAPETFAARFYLGMNADLRAAFGTDEDAARRHWAEHGRVEGRLAAGDVTFARTPDLSALMARPFGVDLHFQVDDDGIEASVGTRLLQALRRAGIPVGLRPFVERGGRVLLPGGDVGRPGTFRATLVAAAPATLRRLLRAHPERHFDATYLIAFFPAVPWAAHSPDVPTLGALDEVWVPTAGGRDRFRLVAPLPVHHVPLPSAPLLPRETARQILGLPVEGTLALIDAAEHEPVPAALRASAEALLERRGDLRLLVRAEAVAVPALANALTGLPAEVFLDRRIDGGSVLLAAADLLRAETDRLAPDIADALAAGRDVEGAAANATRPPPGGSAPAPSRVVADRLSRLGLDAAPPPFVRILARSRETAALPVPPPHQLENVRPDLPVLSLLIAEPLRSPEILATIVDALNAQSHPFWELCAAAAFRVPRHDPRLRLFPYRRAGTRAGRLNEAWSLATGSWLLPAHDDTDARLLAAAIPLLLPHLEQPDADLLVSAPAASGEPTAAPERIESGGPASAPIAFRRDPAGPAAFRDRYGPAAERELLLRRLAEGARARAVAGFPLRPTRPAEDESHRLALSEHLRVRVGPLVRAAPAPRAGGSAAARRTWIMRSGATLLLPGDGPRPAGFRSSLHVLRAVPENLSEIGTEFVVLADASVVRAEPGALEALLEWMAEYEVGAAGGRIDTACGLVHEAGLDLDASGGLRSPCRYLPADPAFAPAAFTLHNPQAVGAILATRRTVLMEAGGFDRHLLEPGGGTILLAADYCLRLARDLGLRAVYVPHAVFARAPEPPGILQAREPTAAERIFADRWR